MQAVVLSHIVRVGASQIAFVQSMAYVGHNREHILRCVFVEKQPFSGALATLGSSRGGLWPSAGSGRQEVGWPLKGHPTSLQGSPQGSPPRVT